MEVQGFIPLLRRWWWLLSAVLGSSWEETTPATAVPTVPSAQMGLCYAITTRINPTYEAEVGLVTVLALAGLEVVVSPPARRYETSPRGVLGCAHILGQCERSLRPCLTPNIEPRQREVITK